MKSNNNGNNALFNGSKPIHVSERVDRLLQFLMEYNELWYENGRSLEEKIDLITSNEDEKKRIRLLYNQAKGDFTALRAIRTRFLERKNGKHTTPAYKITEEQIDSLRQAGVGRSFGLSDENQAEYDRLINSGIDEEIVQYIFKKFSSYKRFREIYCEAMEQGREQDLLKKCPKIEAFLVKDIDLSKQNGIRETDRSYVELLRDILGVKYFVFDGTNLVKHLEDFINASTDKTKIALTSNEKDIIHAIYGLGMEKKSSDEVRQELGITNSRVRQVLSHGLGKLSGRKSQLNNVVYLSDQDEVVKFFTNYFKKNDIFAVKNRNQEQEIQNRSKGYVEVQDIGLSEELYSITFAKKLRSHIDELTHTRAVVSSKLKMQYDTQLDRFESIKLEDFYLKRMLIDKFNLSNRTQNSLAQRSICTIGDIIEFSRHCNCTMQKKIKNMGEKSYDELKELMGKLGLKLEDEDKSEKTRIHNDRALSRMSRIDAAKFTLYLEQIRCRARNSIMQESSTNELDLRVSSIKELHGIRMPNDELIKRINTRIDQLDTKFDYDTTIDVLDVPYEIIRIFRKHGIDKVLDLYRLRDRDVNFMRKKYGAYFDMIIAELNRMGLDYPVKGTAPSNMMKHATYMNKFNVELITFLIEESSISNEKKQKLKKSLLDKIIQIEKHNDQDVDKRLSEKIEELKGAYRALDCKKEELLQLNSCQNITEDAPDSDDIGDIG